jgi:excisionase family DNA binding protein
LDITVIQKNQNNLNSFTGPSGKSCSVCRDLLTNVQQFFDMLGTAGKSPTSEWLTVEDIAKELKISKSIVYRLIRNGELEAVNIVETNGKIAQRGHYRIERSSLNQYLESKKIKPVPDNSHYISRRRQYPKVKNHLGL